jgi:hypothetical protein
VNHSDNVSLPSSGPISSKLERRAQARLNRWLLQQLVASVGGNGCQCFRCTVLARCFLLVDRDPSKVAQARAVLEAAADADRAAERHCDAARESDQADGRFEALVAQLPQLPGGGK